MNQNHEVNEQRVKSLEKTFGLLNNQSLLMRGHLKLVNAQNTTQMAMSMVMWEFISSLAKSHSEILNRLADSNLVSDSEERRDILRRAGELSAECDKIDETVRNYRASIADANQAS